MSKNKNLRKSIFKLVSITFLLSISFILFTIIQAFPANAQTNPDYQKKGQEENIEETKIGIGDEVTIIVKGYDDFSKTVKVDNNGRLQYLPMIFLEAEGLTPSQLKSKIEYTIQPYISSPEVDISVKKVESIAKIGDMLNIIVKGYEDYSQTVEIQKDGRINYLNFGEIQVGGLKTSEIKKIIEDRLKKVISNPEVTISINPEDYILKPGDLVSLNVIDNPKYDYRSKIGKNGKIIHPILGELKVSGKTASMIREQVVELLKPYIVNPNVNVSFEKEVAIAGEVKELEEKKEAPKLEEKEFLINYGDLLSMIVKDHNEYNFDMVVQPDGRISHPLLGEFQAYGFTKSQIAQNIALKLSSYISNPLVTVIVKGRVNLVEMATEQSVDYTFRFGDVIQIRIEGRKNYDYTMVVQPNGKIYYPPLGEINVIGNSIAMLKNAIITKLPLKIGEEQISINIKQFKSTTEEPLPLSAEFPFALRRFGLDFFASAKERILKAEENRQFGYDQEKITQKDAISGFVGPLDMMNANVQATVPDKYILGPGDKINITYWTDVVEPKTESLVVNEKGEVTIEKLGKMVVRGMTLPQFEEAVKVGLSRVAYKDIQLIATLEELRSIQIFITGEVFRPGSYAVSAVTTSANALYMCGGPNENGSLRDIKLIRRNETKSIDFYKFLMKGDSSQDYNLESGDTIMVPLVGKTVTISGEVKRPAIYELKAEENLKELISLAGNIRPTGYLQRIRIDSVDPSRKRIIIDVDMTNPDQTDCELFDGDIVTVFSIPAEKMNTVNIEGKVRMPGTYQLKDGMKISDLINSAQGLLGEAYMERADLIRFNPDKKTTSLIPVDLSKVLSGVDDITLNQWDKLIVYSKWDIKWIADKVVDVHGAVQRPGSYERSDGMKIFDLLIKSGGVLPNAYLDRALLFRRDNTNRITKSIPVNLDLAIKKDENNNIDLYDGDILVVYTIQEARWEPKREVLISGAVQKPSNFIRTDGMKVSDLIKSAGGILPNAYPDKAFLLRLDERQRTTIGFFINLKLAMQDDPNNNLELKDGDELIVYTYEQARWEPKKQVTVSGAVQKSGIYQKTDGMRVSELIFRAGGVLPNAYLDRANIERFIPNEGRYMIIPVNLTKSLAGDKSFDLLLEDEDILRVFTLEEAEYRPDNIVTIYGAVQKPDKYTRFTNMKLSDLLFISGGFLPGANKVVEISRINDMGVIISISVDVTNLLKGDNTNDPELKDGDVVFVRKDKNFLDTLKTVKLEGEVKYPGTYAIKHNERLSELIKRAGGLTDRAYPEASVVTRKIEYLVQNEQEKSLRQVSYLFEELTEQEYKRELAQSWLMHSDKFTNTQSKPTSSSITDIITESTGMGALTEASQQVPNLQELRQFQYTMVTPARKIKSFLPSGRLLINVSEALSIPGSKDNIILEDGDTIVIPSMPSTITVSGAVVQPSSLIYAKGKGVKYYIANAGGYAKDADIKSVYVVKANGMVVNAEDAKLAPGDVIVVPTKVVVQKITDRWGQLFSVIRFSIGAVVSLYMVKILVERL